MSSEDKQGEGFQRTRKALEQLFGPLSDREIRCAVMAYNDAGIHAARSSCTARDAALEEAALVCESRQGSQATGAFRVLGSAADAIRALKSAPVPESGPSLTTTAVLDAMKDHYWDSLEPQRELVIKHIEGVMRLFER